MQARTLVTFVVALFLLALVVGAATWAGGPVFLGLLAAFLLYAAVTSRRALSRRPIVVPVPVRRDRRRRRY